MAAGTPDPLPRAAEGGTARPVVVPPVRRRRMGFVERTQRVNPYLVRGITLMVVLAVWEAAARRINPLFFAPPSAIMAAGVDMIRSGELWAQFLFSMQSLSLGFLAAAVIGIPMGLLMGRYRLFEYMADLYVMALYATPLVALIPLIILWFGLGVAAKVFIVFILSLFSIVINTYVGTRNVSAGLIDVGRAFCANEPELFTKIVAPATVPFIMAGLRLGIGRAIVGMVVAEFFTSVKGLGAIIVIAGATFDTARMLVPVIVLMLLSISLTQLIQWLESRIAPWKRTEGA